MQLSDVLKDTDVVSEIIDELRIEKHFAELSRLPDEKKKVVERRIYDREFAEEYYSNLL